MIVIKNRYIKRAEILKDYPDATFVDVTSNGTTEYRPMSPFYPHGDIPVPYSPGVTAQSVEGIWQGLKVFENQGIDTSMFDNITMKHLKRSDEKFGHIRGHMKGVSWSRADLLSTAEARKKIYAPAYRWVLENKVSNLVRNLREIAGRGTLVLLDFNTNEDINAKEPLSHSALIKAYLEDRYPVVDPNWQEAPELRADLKRFTPGIWVSHPEFGAGEIRKVETFLSSVQFAGGKKTLDLYSGTLSLLDLSKEFVYGDLFLRVVPDTRQLEVLCCKEKHYDRVSIPRKLTINGTDYLVSRIGSRAFVNMRNLRDVVIPSSVTFIDYRAFSGSDGVSQVRKLTSGNEEVSIVENSDGLWGVLEKPSRQLSAFPFVYEKIQFYAAVADKKQKVPTYYFIVMQKGKWGILNKHKHEMEPCIYDSITPKEENGLFVGFDKQGGKTTGARSTPPHSIFKRYIWLIDQVHGAEALGGASFGELDDSWSECMELNPDGESLPRRTFHNHIEAIKEIFGFDIICDRKTNKYHIAPAEDDSARALQKDYLSFLALNEKIELQKGIGQRILYEEQPSVPQVYVHRVIEAMKSGRKISLTYRKFGESEASVRLLEPYCLKMFRRRWYLLAKEGKELKTFALDSRTRKVTIEEAEFRYPANSFDPRAYFADTFGIRRSEPEVVVIKAYGSEADYLRSVPLHPSQKEKYSTDSYAVFTLTVGTEAWELVQELLSRGSRIEVFKPESLRKRMAEELESTRSLYADIWQKPVGNSGNNSDIAVEKISLNMNNFPTWSVTAYKEKAAKSSFAARAARTDVFKNNNEIFAAGGYRTDSGAAVQLQGNDDPMLKGTEVVSEKIKVPTFGPIVAAGTETSVINDDSFRVAKKMLDEGLTPAVLNLASPRTAGGGYHRGSGAQEESLCRASTLSRSLYQYFTPEMAGAASVPFKERAYPLHERFGGIYSPGVTVFRDSADGYRLMENPNKVAVITVAALNFADREKYGQAIDAKYRTADYGFTPEGVEIMKDKIRTIYDLALIHGHDSLVLGAFGCGAYHLRPDLVAPLFRDILDEDEYFGRFKDIRFAILETGKPEDTGRNGKFAPFYILYNDNQ